MPIRKIIIYCTFMLFVIPKIKCQDYAELRKKYELYPENDARALRNVTLYIQLAKKRNDLSQMVQGYKDAVYFTKNTGNKFQYADSCIATAEKSKNSDLISSAHLLKGSLYYYTSQKYKFALDEYLKAYENSQNSQDLYLQHKILYHIGIVKSYMGYYQDALVHFEGCMAFFEKKMRDQLPAKTLYNHTKGYLNSLHQSIICYRHLKNYVKADSLIAIGRRMTEQRGDYPQEKNYFLKSLGISEYHHGNYENSLALLQQSLPGFIKTQDYGWYGISNYYIGQNYIKLQKTEKAIRYFKRVDSIFQKHRFIFPELRENYVPLISYYKKRKNTEKELYYNKTLLKIDSIVHKDFAYLSSRIHKEYDTVPLKEKEKALILQKKLSIGIMIIVSVIIPLIGIRYRKDYKKEQDIYAQYKILKAQLLQQKKKSLKKGKPKFSEDLFLEIERKLYLFEQQQKYSEKGLTLNKLAKRFGTNTKYLSHVVHESKKTNFNRYLSELRIRYITELMYYDKNYLKYTVETLADECGLNTRQNFSDLFQEINGLRPKDFIQQRMDELVALEIIDKENHVEINL